MCRHADYSHYIVQVLPLNEVLGQSTVLPFLGIKLDAATMKLHLTSLPAIFSKVMAGQEVMYKEGWLAAYSMWANCETYLLRHMIDLATTTKELQHHIWFNQGFQSYLLWLATFLKEWNGLSMLSTITHMP